MASVCQLRFNAFESSFVALENGVKYLLSALLESLVERFGVELNEGIGLWFVFYFNITSSPARSESGA